MLVPDFPKRGVYYIHTRPGFAWPPYPPVPEENGEEYMLIVQFEKEPEPNKGFHRSLTLRGGWEAIQEDVDYQESRWKGERYEAWVMEDLSKCYILCRVFEDKRRKKGKGKTK